MASRRGVNVKDELAAAYGAVRRADYRIVDLERLLTQPHPATLRHELQAKLKAAKVVQKREAAKVHRFWVKYMQLYGRVPTFTRSLGWLVAGGMYDVDDDPD